MLEEQLRTVIQDMPKIELHRHLEGAVRLSTMSEIAREYPLDIPNYDSDALRRRVQMMPGDVRDAQNFLDKFITIRQFFRTRDIVARIAREVVIDAARDNIRYMELRFTPKALGNITQAPLDEIVALVCDAANAAAAEYDILVRYIVSMNRHESVELGEEALRAALKNQDKGVVGIDLAGDEENHDGLDFRQLFKRARAAGLGITIHAGEWAGAGSVWNAIGNLGAQRIGHGINVLDDPAMVQVIIEREITLEVCPSSNVLSGVVDSMYDHPLARLNEQRVLTTINTDDPSICDVTLSDEIIRAMQQMNLSLDDIKASMIRAARAAFLAPPERDRLVREFQGLMANINYSDAQI